MPPPEPSPPGFIEQFKSSPGFVPARAPRHATTEQRERECLSFRHTCGRGLMTASRDSRPRHEGFGFREMAVTRPAMLPAISMAATYASPCGTSLLSAATARESGRPAGRRFQREASFHDGPARKSITTISRHFAMS